MSAWEDGPEQFKPKDPGEHGDNHLRFRFTRFRDIELETAPAYIVDEFGVVVIWGKPKSGKTFWTYDIEMHVALGWTYRGHRVEQGEVLHIACEGVRGLSARKKAWRLHHIQGKSAAEIAAIDAAPFYLCKDTALDLIKDANKVIEDIIVQFGGKPIKVITIDTLNRSLRGSESKDEDMGAYIRAAILLAEQFRCIVLIIHHCGWNEDRPRGHSSLLGSADALIETKKDTAGKICTQVEEMRDGPCGATTHSKLVAIEVGRDINDNPITSCVIVPDQAAAAQAAKKADGKPPSPLAQKFYDALINVGAKGSAEQRATSNGRSSITEDQWIAELVQRGLIDPQKDDSRRSLISKCRRELVTANWIACNGNILWTIRREHTSASIGGESSINSDSTTTISFPRQKH